MEPSVISLRLIRTDTVAIIGGARPAEPWQPDLRHDARVRGGAGICRSSARTQAFGFAIARAVARAHGGTLIVGAGDDGGTTAAFSITLRAPDKEDAGVPPVESQIDYTGGISQELIEMSDVLPIEVFDSVNVN